jgi:hypothetical protein
MPVRALTYRENSNMVKVALKDLDFEAVRRIASIAAVCVPLAILGACGQNSSSSGDVTGTAEKEVTPPAPPSGDEATPPSTDESAAPSGDEATPPAADEGAGSSDDSGSTTAPDSSGTE